jgi:16S rRNA (guanine1207-N2)-methyltransferase
MFSPDQADAGSMQLSDLIAGKLRGKGADLGAGWGWLAKRALDQNPEISTLDLYEAEYAAVQCAKKNVADSRATAHWADVTALTGPADHDFVIMNPPFHQSRKADPELGRQFIAAAARLLQPKGTLWMVANRQLAYETSLQKHFQSWEILKQSGGFKSIRAMRPRH